MRELTRRDFLRLSAMTAAGVVAAACAQPTPMVIEKEVIKEVEVEKPVVVKEEVVKEVPVEKVVEKEVIKEVPVEKVVEKVVTATPLPMPEEVHEAPMLRKLVEAGELPPLEERLPPEPMVIEPVEEIGQYGGTWRCAHWGPGMGNIKMIIAYDALVRWNRELTDYIPGLAKKWEYSEDGRTLTFYLRKGLKWSDGHPFTTEDLKFWWEDLALNEDYKAISPPWWLYGDGKLAEAEFVDDYTVSFHLPAPNYIAYSVTASGFWEWEPIIKPKHYLSQFHPKYNPEVEDWSTFEDKDHWWQNPDYPTVFMFHCVEYIPGERAVFERNPYYWKVDTAGNQLPYIDRFESVEVPDPEVQLLQIVRGEYSAIFRGANEDPRNLPTLLEKQVEGDYRVILWTSGTSGWPGFTVNQNYVEDEWMRDLLRNHKFMVALSHTIDRKRINQVLWYGLAREQQAAITEESWHYGSPEGHEVWEEWAHSYVEYDPEKANSLLDEIGLTGRDAEGFRTRPDGSRLEIIFDITSNGGAEVNSDAAPLLKEMWEAAGLRIILNAVYGTPADDLRQTEGTYQLRTEALCECDLWTYPSTVFPVKGLRSWPMVGKWFATGGKEGWEPELGSPEARLLDLFERALKEPDPDNRHRMVWDAARIHMDEGPFMIATVGDHPAPAVVKNNFRNVPDFGIICPWAVGCPGNTNPEQYFFKQK